MEIPTVEQAEAYLAEGGRMNPGPWVEHSLYVGKAGKAIAERHPSLDSETAYVVGILHDIGRRAGYGHHMRHIIEGYNFMMAEGFADAARICMTHSFPLQNINAVFGRWDCTAEEKDFAEKYITELEYDEYDRLFQLCDGLALPSGFCLLEKRMMNVALRYGLNEFIVPKWKATFDIKAHFETLLGHSIYQVLPGVIENTFELEKNE